MKKRIKRNSAFKILGMKYLHFKYINISVVLILLFIGGGCETSDGYKITGMLYGFADNTKVSLTLAATHQDEKKEMETTVQDGKFTFVGKLVETSLLYVDNRRTDRSTGYLRVYAGK